MEEIGAILREVWGGDEARELSAGQMVVRAVTVFCLTVVLVRLGKRRMLARNSAIDFVGAIVLGSVLSRAINGSAPFLPTLAASAALIFLHWISTLLAVHSQAFGALVKGGVRVLVRDGVADQAAMRRSHVTEHDLEESLRIEAHLTRIEEVGEARLERSGRISVLPKKDAEGRDGSRSPGSQVV